METQMQFASRYRIKTAVAYMLGFVAIAIAGIGLTYALLALTVRV